MMNEYNHEILENSVGGLELKIFGVDYAETRFQEHEELYDDLISNSICVVSEYSPVESGFPDFPLMGEPVTWKATKVIRNLCERYGKKIFKVDPLNLIGHAIDTSIVVGSLVAPFFLSELTDKFIGRKLGRRKFLGVLGALAYLGLSTHYPSNLFLLPEGATGKFLRAPTFGNNDARNVRIAEGLEIIPEMLQNVEGDYILALHSWPHTKPIDYYLTHGAIRQAKGLVYSATYNLVNDGFVRMYDVNEGSLWKEVGRKQF